MDLAADGDVLGEDMPCGECEYNLRGLGVDGQCPECGTAVRASLHRGLLRYSRPRYVWNLRKAITWMLWGRWLGVTFYVLYWTVRITGMLAASTPISSSLVSWATYVAAVVTLTGMWKLSRATGHVSKSIERATTRNLLRWSIGACSVILVLHIGVNQHLYLPLHAYRPVIYAMSPILSIFNTVFLFQFLALLIGSMPDMPMAKWARQIMWVFIASELIQLLIEVSYIGLSSWIRPILIASRSPTAVFQRYSTMSLCLFGAQTLVSLAVSGFWIPFLVALRRRFAEQLVLAREYALDPGRWLAKEHSRPEAGSNGLQRHSSLRESRH
jgi:hypothetical protein